MPADGKAGLLTLERSISQAPQVTLRGFFTSQERNTVFAPYLAAVFLAAVFAHLGAMTMRIAILTSTINVLIVLVIAMVTYILWRGRKP